MLSARRFLVALLLLATVRIPIAQAGVIKDVEYGRAEGQRLLLDVRIPDGAGPFPVAILVHGGGWTSGDKSGSNHPGDGADISPWFDLLAADKFVSFSINYRQAPQFRWPAAIDDVATAVEWVSAHAGEYKGDARRIVLFGHSAGGHLVTFAATQPSIAKYVRAVVGFAPVTDLEADSVRRGGLSLSLQNLLGRGKEITADARALLRQLSPIDRLHVGMPPILIIQGDTDRTVPIEQSRAFFMKLRELGVPAEMIVRKGVPHSLIEGEKIDRTYEPVMVDWLRRALATEPATMSK